MEQSILQDSSSHNPDSYSRLQVMPFVGTLLHLAIGGDDAIEELETSFEGYQKGTVSEHGARVEQMHVIGVRFASSQLILEQ
mmetsp:Transcript_21005/g.30848  ORF Transcript_21005/g.30848 Transcript_21005/m.30848 type:complete len:82 (-) Transcript_21005:38-283(-)